MARAAMKSASVRTEHHVILSLDNAHVLPGGSVNYATKVSLERDNLSIDKT